jgi:YARHG domain
MNPFFLLFPLFLLLFTSCENKLIKNNSAKVENEIDSTSIKTTQKLQKNANTKVSISNKTDMIGFWVGDFEPPVNKVNQLRVAADDGLYWSRENKINLSIDEITGNIVKGHSVVAGNSRPFEGTCDEKNDKFIFVVSEPGDDKYDGKFAFSVLKNDSIVKGNWKSYKKIDVSERTYSLNKKNFNYNLNQALGYSRRYADWDKSKTIKITDKEEIELMGDFDVLYSSATHSIYEINASNTLLNKKEVENLKKGDLLIIRNTIYARHGYSFKNRPLRVFFDAQSWYIPVHTDIKSALTPTEKQNIELLLKYEKNAKEYYDKFGRG